MDALLGFYMGGAPAQQPQQQADATHQIDQFLAGLADEISEEPLREPFKLGGH